MALAFNEEQRSIKDTARNFAQNQSPIESFRTLRNSELKFSRDVWAQMIELGWGGMTFPEQFGGFDFGFMGLAGCMEEFGRTLVASPLISSVVLSGSTILYAGTEEQKSTWLPQIASGEKLIALAVDEGAHHNPSHIALTAKQDGDHFVLNGNKTMVIDGHAADVFIIAVRTSGDVKSSQGISLCIVDANTAGISREQVSLIDNRGYARISCKNVRIPASAILGEIDKGFTALDMALDRGRICLSAEMLGGMHEIFERTVQYLKERKQFGVLIGSFQALQHRAAHLYTELHICRSSLMSALHTLENTPEHAPALISAAKAKISDTYELLSNEAVQMHGGIGVTDELDIGLFLKRARVSAQLLGSTSFHLQRFATLEGF